MSSAGFDPVIIPKHGPKQTLIAQIYVVEKIITEKPEKRTQEHLFVKHLKNNITVNMLII